MDRRTVDRDDGTEQGSANIFLCGLPPTPDAFPSFKFPGFNTTLLYVAPPDKEEEVKFVYFGFLKPIHFSMPN